MTEPTFEDLMGTEAVEDAPLDEGTKLAAHDLFLRLRASFSPPAYITLEEVRDATGFDGVRTADAIAISLYRSRGKAVWGFEMKVSRNDWLKELKQPEKAESMMRYCNYWALVVPSKDIVKDGELPATWGMYVAQKNRLKCVVPCPKLEPLPISLTFLTALLYNIDHSHKMADKKILDAEYSRGHADGSKRSYDHSWEKNFKSLEEKVRAFEAASGLQIEYGWQRPEKLGAAVKTILDADSSISRLLAQSKRGVEAADELKKQLQRHVEVLEAVVHGVSVKEDEEF